MGQAVRVTLLPWSQQSSLKFLARAIADAGEYGYSLHPFTATISFEAHLTLPCADMANYPFPVGHLGRFGQRSRVVPKSEKARSERAFLLRGGCPYAALRAVIRWVVEDWTSNVRMTGSVSRRCFIVSWTCGYCSRW